MRIIIKTLLVIIGIAVLLSCEEDFSALGDYHDQYIVTAQLNVDSTTHRILLSKSSINPAEGNPSLVSYSHVSGADIKIISGENVFEFSEVVNQPVMPGIDSNISAFYECRNFAPKNYETLDLFVQAPDGQNLISEIKPVKNIYRNFIISSDVFPPPLDTVNFVEVHWNYLGISFYTFRNFYVTYYRKENEKYVKYTREVPSEYLETKDGLVPVYYRFNNQNAFGAQEYAITQALTDLAAEGENKQSVYIDDLYLELYFLDENLSAYYSSVGVEPDRYSIQLNSKDYTNIQGGYGLFGSYAKIVVKISITWELIKSLGYSPYVGN